MNGLTRELQIFGWNVFCNLLAALDSKISWKIPSVQMTCKKHRWCWRTMPRHCSKWNLQITRVNPTPAIILCVGNSTQNRRTSRYEQFSWILNSEKQSWIFLQSSGSFFTLSKRFITLLNSRLRKDHFHLEWHFPQQIVEVFTFQPRSRNYSHLVPFQLNTKSFTRTQSRHYWVIKGREYSDKKVVPLFCEGVIIGVFWVKAKLIWPSGRARYTKCLTDFYVSV